MLTNYVNNLSNLVNQFILTTYTGNGNCIINVLPGGANISCSVGICGTANLLYTDTYNFY